MFKNVEMVCLNRIESFSYGWNVNSDFSCLERLKSAMVGFFCGVTVTVIECEFLYRNHRDCYSFKSILKKINAYNVTHLAEENNKLKSVSLLVPEAEGDNDDKKNKIESCVVSSKSSEGKADDEVSAGAHKVVSNTISELESKGGEINFKPSSSVSVKHSVDEFVDDIAVVNYSEHLKKTNVIQELSNEQEVLSKLDVCELEEEYSVISQPNHSFDKLRNKCNHEIAKSDDAKTELAIGDIDQKERPGFSLHKKTCFCDRDFKYEPGENSSSTLVDYIRSSGAKIFLQSNNIWCGDDCSDRNRMAVKKCFLLAGSKNDPVKESFFCGDANSEMRLANYKGYSQNKIMRSAGFKKRTRMEVVLSPDILVVSVCDCTKPMQYSFFSWMIETITKGKENDNGNDTQVVVNELRVKEQQFHIDKNRKINEMKKNKEAIAEANDELENVLKMDNKDVLLLTERPYANDSVYEGYLTASSSSKIKKVKLFDGSYNTKVDLRLTDEEIKKHGLNVKKVPICSDENYLSKLDGTYLVCRSSDDLKPIEQNVYRQKVELTPNQKIVRGHRYEMKYYIYDENIKSFVRVKPSSDDKDARFFIQYSRSKCANN